jgi:hypothetical protein
MTNKGRLSAAAGRIRVPGPSMQHVSDVGPSMQSQFY